MRVSHIEYRMEQQFLVSEWINASFENFVKVSPHQITIQRVQTRLEALNEQWARFNVANEAILLAIQQLSEEERILIKQHRYFTQNLVNTTYELFLDNLEKMNAIHDELKQTSPSIPSPSTSLSSNQSLMHHTNPSIILQNSRLPQIELPKFNGKSADWLSFRNLFDSLVMTNATLSDVEKLQYLKTSLTGSAALLLKNTPLTADSFRPAWDSLVQFYENKRLLVNSAFQSLLTLKPMLQESATGIENLYTTVTQIYRTFETLNRPVHHWDDFLVFFTVRLLDPASRRAWEKSLGSDKEPPTWKRLITFLTTRLLSIQAYDSSSQSGTSYQAGFRKPSRSFQVNLERAATNPKTNSLCVLCKETHFIYRCPKFQASSLEQRRRIVKNHNLCFNCLSNHQVNQCRSTRRCLTCGKKHNTLLHMAESTDPQTISTKNSDKANDSEKTLLSHVGQLGASETILLATAQVHIQSIQGRTVRVRVMIDPGSQISFITETLVNALKLNREPYTRSLRGIGGIKAGRTRGKVSLTLNSRFSISKSCTITASVLKRITKNSPSTELSTEDYSLIEDLSLADPHFDSDGRIDILIGLDHYGKVILPGLRKDKEEKLVVQNTIFGWIISGPIADADSINSFHISIDAEVQELLTKFWQTEEVLGKSTAIMTPDEQHCENHFQSTVSRNAEGRYIVQLPFKETPNKLGQSFQRASQVLDRLFHKFQQDDNYFSLYQDFLRDYEASHHMIKTSISKVNQKPHHYLPHHGVFRPNSTTTKLRVVFNGSSKTTTGISLNDLLHTGPKLQINIFDVIIWFRKFPFVIFTDIKQMYRQIQLHESNWDYQRILWKDEQGEQVAFQLTTVTYGLSCAPYLALRTIKQLISDEGKKFPLAVDTLTYGRYVDDIFGGADTEEAVTELIQQLKGLCLAGGFPLQKWQSNQSRILASLEKPASTHVSSIDLSPDNLISTLGLNWSPNSDAFQFSFNLEVPDNITKRSLLSCISRIFDPLGFLSPILIPAKLILQDIWLLRVGWDQELPLSIQTKWKTIVENLKRISTINIPRWFGSTKDSKKELHGFCDASQFAYSAVLYLKTVSPDKRTSIAFICSKTKVAPLKKLTIPRLELCGAILLTKLVAQFGQAFREDCNDVFLWTDSSITYTWITHHPSRWKEYVRNRVCFIQETLPNAKWYLVAGDENPADLAARGIALQDMIRDNKWWKGPDWLCQPPTQWPVSPLINYSFQNTEEVSTMVHLATTSNKTEYCSLLSRYSKLHRLIKMTAVCRRVANRLKRIPNSSLQHPITPDELTQAKFFWTKVIQDTHFKAEVKLIQEHQYLPKNHPLSNLTPFLDKFGILRVGGRLEAAPIPENSKHPIIIPKGTPLTTLIIEDAHSRTLHGGTQLTLSSIRQEYWILGGRKPIQSFILNCVRCARFRQRKAKQLMGQLPVENVTPSPPFYHSGVDYAGPITLKAWKHRTTRTYKAYIAIFVCFSTSAIHIELVTDYTTEAFIAAYRRFISRRGRCKTLRSDCGTNFKGADKELKSLFSLTAKHWKHMASILACDGTQWFFNPPGSPHFGGKWEAGVKSLKYHLRRILGNHRMTYEDMNTLLIQIEGILNSRPLCPLYDDPNDLDVLTPGHFLMGRAPTLVPEPSSDYLKISTLNHWKRVQHVLQQFWNSWSKSYLQRYLSTYKWKHSTPPLKEGAIVLIVDERYPPAKWPIGRIISLHPGKDGRVRVVTVKTQTNTMQRSIVKICPLPIDVLPEDLSLSCLAEGGREC